MEKESFILKPYRKFLEKSEKGLKDPINSSKFLAFVIFVPGSMIYSAHRIKESAPEFFSKPLVTTSYLADYVIKPGLAYFLSSGLAKLLW